MDKETEREAGLSLQAAARIAEQILAQAPDGTKLIGLTNHYPMRGRAVSFGFHFGLGLGIAIAFFVLISKLVDLALAML